MATVPLLRMKTERGVPAVGHVPPVARGGTGGGWKIGEIFSKDNRVLEHRPGGALPTAPWLQFS